MKRIGFLILGCTLVGCSMQGGSVGNPELAQSTKAELYQIINDNITTKSDARRNLGDPSDIDYDGVSKIEKWTYLHIDKRNLKRNYIPLLNFFTKGTEEHQKKVILIFDRSGMLLKSLVTESLSEHKNGWLD